MWTPKRFWHGPFVQMTNRGEIERFIVEHITISTVQLRGLKWNSRVIAFSRELERKTRVSMLPFSAARWGCLITNAWLGANAMVPAMVTNGFVAQGPWKFTELVQRSRFLLKHNIQPPPPDGFHATCSLWDGTELNKLRENELPNGSLISLGLKKWRF